MFTTTDTAVPSPVLVVPTPLIIVPSHAVVAPPPAAASVFNFPVSREKLFFGDGTEVYKEAIVRDDTRDVLGIVSPSYKMINHSEALEKTEVVMSRMGGWKLAAANATKNGARIFVKYMLNEEKFIVTARNGVEDAVAPTLTMINSYDGLLKFGFILGAYQFICLNGLRIGHDIFEASRRHTEGLDIDDIMLNAEKSMMYFKTKTYPRYREMSEIRVERMGEFLDSLTEQNKVPQRLVSAARDRILYDPKIETLWDVYSVFTNIITHHSNKMAFERKDKVNQLVSRAFGL